MTIPFFLWFFKYRKPLKRIVTLTSNISKHIVYIIATLFQKRSLGSKWDIYKSKMVIFVIYPKII